MLQKFKMLVFIVLSVYFFYGCDSDSETTPPPTGGDGNLVILLTDAPAVYDSVKITFSEVNAHIDSGWITVRGNPFTVDLMQLNNGNTIVLGDSTVPAGDYSQIRLIIDTAYIVVDGQPFPLDVPSGTTSGLKLNAHFTISTGVTYQIVLDFDVSRSIVTTGPPSNPTGYKLKPVIRVIAIELSGFISGTVTNPIDVPIAYVIQNTDTLSSSFVDTLNGDFLLAYLPAGTYTVAIEDTLGKTYTQSGVSVDIGQTTNIGSVTLQ